MIDVDEGPGKAGGDVFNDLQFLHGDIPVTVRARTGGGGRHILLQHPKDIWVRTGRNVLGPGVDVRGDGGFIVAAPSLHESGQYYLWDDAAHPRVTPIAAAPAWVIEMAEAPPPHPATGARAPSTGSGEIVRDAWGKVIDGRERFMIGIVCGCIATMKRETGTLPTAEAVVAEAWPTYERGARARGASLEADGRGITLMRQRVAHFLGRVERGQWKPDAAVKPKEALPFDPETGEIIAPFEATPVESLDLEIIPPRRWVYGRELIRGYVSVLAAIGGAGKTAYAMSSVICIVLGRPMLGVNVHGRGIAWLYNLEDPAEEMRRRLAAIMRHMGVTKADLAGRLYMDSGRDRALMVTVRTRDGGLYPAPVVDALVAEIKRRGVTTFVPDPLVHSHGASENNNEEMAFVMSLWARVAHEGDCAIWLIHHFRKGGQGGDADAVRGAGAIQGAARAMHTLATMTEEEAERLGIKPDDRRQFIRHDPVKQNMAAPASRAVWYRLVGVNLNNATLAYPDGDEVQAIEAWAPPSPWTGLTWAMIDSILTRIEAGLPTGEPCAYGKQSGDRWAGHAITEVHDIAAGQVSEILRRWKDAGVLVISTWVSTKTRKETGCVKVDFAIFQKMRRVFKAPPDAGL